MPADTMRAPAPPAGYLDTVRRLGASQKRAASGAPAYSVYVNRKLGRLLAAAAYLAGLTPNGVTAISAAFTFGAILLLVALPPTIAVGVAVGLCLIVGYAFDSADGQLARLRGGGSPSGEWLDHVIDCIKTSALHLAVLVSLYRFAPDVPEVVLIVPLAFSVVASVGFFAQILNDQLKAVHAAPGTAAPRRSTLLRSLIVAPTDYGLLCVVFLLLGTPLFLPVYAVLFAASLGHLALALPKWFRDMSRLGRPTAAGVSR